MSDLAELLVQDAEAWRVWLDSHYADHPGVWLVLRKKGGQTTALTYAHALDAALCFGWIDGQISRRDDGSYRQRFTPRRPNSPWSARNVEHVARLTEAGRMQPAGIAAVDAAKAQGRWQAAYRGQADMQTPPDLAQALAANPAAAATFEQLDAANRYAIVYRLNTVKRPTTRDRKLAEYVDMLARGESLHPRKSRKGRAVIVTIPPTPKAHRDLVVGAAVQIYPRPWRADRDGRGPGADPLPVSDWPSVSCRCCQPSPARRSVACRSRPSPRCTLTAGCFLGTSRTRPPRWQADRPSDPTPRWSRSLRR